MADAFDSFSRGPVSGNARSADATTLASIVAAPTFRELDAASSLAALGASTSLASLAAATALSSVASRVVQVENITSFSYVSNVMQMGDPFTVDVPDPRGVYVDKLMPGWSVRFYMSNPSVNGGARTTKVDGIITQRDVTVDPHGGTVMHIAGADLGWHLMNNDAPLWTTLRATAGATPTLEQLAKACIFPKSIDTGWGFAPDIGTSNEENRSIKRGLVFTASEKLSLKLSGIAAPVQVQPGQKISDLLISWARRAGLLVGVTVTRQLQFFLPQYGNPPKHAIYLYGRDDPKAAALNNAQQARRVDTLDTLYTHVTVVGEDPIRTEVVGGAIKTFSPQANRFYGKAKPADWPASMTALPFVRQASITDGEIVEHPRRRARWFQNRGFFESQVVTFEVRGHYQADESGRNGAWWEADTMCVVRAPVLGIDGTYYVPMVECRRDMQSGDVTRVTLRRPNLLTEIPVS